MQGSSVAPRRVLGPYCRARDGWPPDAGRVEAAELLGQGDGRALVLTEHHEPAAEDVIGDKLNFGDLKAGRGGGSGGERVAGGGGERVVGGGGRGERPI